MNDEKDTKTILKKYKYYCHMLPRLKTKAKKQEDENRSSELENTLWLITQVEKHIEEIETHLRWVE